MFEQTQRRTFVMGMPRFVRVRQSHSWNHVKRSCFTQGAAERNFAGGDGASKADPGIFEILCFLQQ